MVPEPRESASGNGVNMLMDPRKVQGAFGTCENVRHRACGTRSTCIPTCLYGCGRNKLDPLPEQALTKQRHIETLVLCGQHQWGEGSASNANITRDGEVERRSGG